jgi:polysaccharide chain length determinant protein (PEP-CTERM system associated)
MEPLEIRRSSLRDFLHVVFKRKNQILLFFIVTVCTVAIGTFVVKPTYEAKTQVLVKIGRENLYVPPGGGNSPIINLNRDNQINSEIELLKSRTLVEQVVESLGSENIYKNIDYKDAVLTLQKKLSIEGIKKSDVIAVSFKHKDPEMAALVVNTLAKAYMEHHLDVHKNPASYNFFEEQSEILKNKLELSEKTLKAFKEKHQITALDEEQRLLLRQIGDLRAELNLTLSNEAETENRIGQLRQQINRTPETIPQGEEIDHNPFLISNLEARLVELELKEKTLLTKYTPQSRLVQNVKEEIQMVQNKLTAQETKRYGKSRTGLNTTYQRMKEGLFQNQAEQKALTGKKEAQNTQLANFQEKLERLNRIEVELSQLQQAVDVDRQNYRLYLSKFEEARISDAMDTKKITNVSLIEPALSPLKPVSPKVFLNLVLSIFLGGFGGLGLAFFSEYLDDSLEKPEDVEEALQIPVLASIPELETGR